MPTPRKLSAKPGQPPGGADMAALIAALNETRAKVSLAPHVSKLPVWKRWVGGEKPEYDGTGLRDVVQTNAVYLDAVKADVDSLRGSTDHRLDVAEAKIAALEAAPPTPFPG